MVSWNMFKNLKRLFGNEKPGMKTYPADLSSMRKNLHELVEAGKMREAAEAAGRHYGFTKFPDARRFHSLTFSVDMTLQNGKWCTENDTLQIGYLKIEKLTDYARRIKDGFVERRIESLATHEAGHTFKPKKPVRIERKTVVNEEGRVIPYHGNGKIVPYAADELTNARIDKGIDIDSEKAKNEDESQADLYSAVKNHEGRTLDELMQVMAETIWDNRILGFFNFTETKNAAREYMRDRNPWLKPGAVEKMANTVVEIHKKYKPLWLKMDDYRILPMC